MTVSNVYMPQKNKVDDSGQKMTQIGGLISMIPHPAAKAVGGGMAAFGTLKQMTTKQPKQIGQQGPIGGGAPSSYRMPSQTPRAAQAELDMPDYSGAISRRERAVADNPEQALIDARAAIEALEMDQEAKMRLQKPIDIALQAQRSFT